MELETELLRVTGTAEDKQSDRAVIEKAASVILGGGLVAMPTETVYGMAANALDPTAVERIFAAKGRPQDNPLIAHIADIAALAPLVREVPVQAMKLAEAFWPGPFTMVLQRSRLVPDVVSAGLPTVALRMPSHPVARDIIRAAGVPVAAPSANLSGRPSTTTAQHCADDLWGKVELIVDGGSCAVGLESTVITLTTSIPRLLRPGAITVAQIEAVIGKVDVDPAVLSHLDDGASVASPGMKYKHYSPKAQVVLLSGTTDRVMAYLANQQEDHIFALVFAEDMAKLPIPGYSMGSAEDASSQAAVLFGLLRDLDALGAKKIFARSPSKEGVGLAVYNRLIRAAGFQELKL